MEAEDSPEEAAEAGGRRRWRRQIMSLLRKLSAFIARSETSYLIEQSYVIYNDSTLPKTMNIGI